MEISIDLAITYRPDATPIAILSSPGERDFTLSLFKFANGLHAIVTSHIPDDECNKRSNDIPHRLLLGALASPPVQNFILQKLGTTETIDLLDKLDDERRKFGEAPLPRILSIANPSIGLIQRRRPGLTLHA